MVFLDSGDTAAVTATASDPDNDPLTYTWSASGGRVDGTGAQVRWLSAGTAAGTYTVSAHVDDGRGGVATCSADIRVEPKPNRPPTIACSANPSSVFAGERVHITCNASDPDGDPLTYTWRANAGRITGNGPEGTLTRPDYRPELTRSPTRVDDGRGGAADASTAVTVKAVPPPPQASKINECAFGKPLSTRIDNVCKRILDDVALRLQNEPRASAVIIGYSDPKERNPRQVAGDRGTNAVKYLGEKGIDASRVTTRTGSGQAGAQRKPPYRRHLCSRGRDLLARSELFFRALCVQVSGPHGARCLFCRARGPFRAGGGSLIPAWGRGAVAELVEGLE